MNLVRSSARSLQTNGIDLWFIEPLQLTSLSVEHLMPILSSDEITKLSAYKHQAAKYTSLMTRIFSRLVLSQYTGTSPADFQFLRNQYGKPELLPNPSNIRFNLSHNNNLIIMAVTINDDIGCDIEDPKRNVSVLPISKRYFAKQEYQALCLLEGDEQKQQFFKYWTLKEAFVKAVGVGIALGLDTFYFTLSGDKKTQEIDVKFNSDYPLDKQNGWQSYQGILNHQMLAVCRKSTIKQTVNYLNAKHLFSDNSH